MKEIIWSGLVNGKKCRVWFDGHTDEMQSSGLYERKSNANEIVAKCVSQLIDKAKESEETLRIRRANRI